MVTENDSTFLRPHSQLVVVVSQLISGKNILSDGPCGGGGGEYEEQESLSKNFSAESLCTLFEIK